MLNVCAPMRKLLVTGCVLGCCLAFAQSQILQVFSQEDLEALEKQEAWQELLTHLGDITPAKSSERWSQLLEKSALGVLSTYKGQTEKSWSYADAVVKQYPQLKKSKRFMEERAQLGPKGLDACLASLSSMTCTDRAVSYPDAEPTNAQLAWSLARLVV